MAVAVGAVFGPEGILLIRRAREPFTGLWGLPGGKVHRGEHLDEAVEREVREETGVCARFEELCGVVTELLCSGRRRRMHYLLLVCRLSARSTALRPSAEGEVRWLGAEELEGMEAEIIPSDRLILNRLVLDRTGQRFYRCVVRRSRGRYRVERFR